MVRKLVQFFGGFFLLSVFFFTQNGFAQETPISKIKIILDADFIDSASITGKSIEFSAKVQVVSISVYNLLRSNIYHQFYEKIRRRILLDHEKYLLSFQIENGESDEEKIAIGFVKAQLLAEALLKQSIPLKKMPVYNVALLYSDVALSEAQRIKSHLAKFNIKILTFKNRGRENTKAKLFSDLSKIFEEFPAITTAYLLEKTKNRENFLRLSMKVFGKGNLNLITEITTTTNDFEQAQKDQTEQEEDNFHSFFLQKLNPISLKTKSYQKTTELLTLNIHEPFLPTDLYLFSVGVLNRSSFVESYYVQSLTTRKASYGLQIYSGKQNNFLKYLEKNTIFSFRIVRDSENLVEINNFSKKSGSITSVRRINFDNDSERETVTRYFPEISESEIIFGEKERNNTVDSANFAPFEAVVKGTVEKRLDQDLFVIDLSTAKKIPKLGLLVSKDSSFQLKITVYDEDLKKFDSFLPLRREYQKFSFAGLTDKSQKIYLRFEDRVGYTSSKTGRLIPLRYYFRVQ